MAPSVRSVGDGFVLSVSPSMAHAITRSGEDGVERTLMSQYKEGSGEVGQVVGDVAVGTTPQGSS